MFEEMIKNALETIIKYVVIVLIVYYALKLLLEQLRFRRPGKNSWVSRVIRGLFGLIFKCIAYFPKKGIERFNSRFATPSRILQRYIRRMDRGDNSHADFGKLKKNLNKLNRGNHKYLYIIDMGLILLTFGLMFLNVKGQFRLWYTLFDPTTAVLALLVFLMLRLVAIYLLLKFGEARRSLCMTFYLTIAVFSGLTATPGWQAKMMDSEVKKTAVRQEWIDKSMTAIKRAYAAKIEETIKMYDKDIYWIDSKLAWNYSNYYTTYYKTRKKQIVRDRKVAIEKRDAFLAEVPEDAEAWIEKHAVILGVVIEPMPECEVELSGMGKVVTSLRSMDIMDARKTVAIIYVIVIELGIFSLALIIGRKLKKQTFFLALKSNEESDRKDVDSVILEANR